MTPPTNTYTVQFADAHAHTVSLAGVPGNSGSSTTGNTMAGKADALRNVLNEAADNAANILSAFTAADTLTITITQP